MRKLLLFLLISWTPLCAPCQQSSPPLLTEAEKRLILSQLYELEACRAQIAAYSDYVAREKEQDAREKASWERALELECQPTLLAEKERDLAKEKAALYEQLYRSVTHKPGWGCRMAKVFTLGMAQCN